MGQQIQIKRGLKVDLPTLAIGEFGYCTDTDELFLGTESGNRIIDADTFAFVHRCTGENDSAAIAGIVNDFFDGGAAMTMKLVITGTMDIQGTMRITPSQGNQRGAVCYLDFSDCHIPENLAFDFMRAGGGARLDITGLSVTSAGQCIRCRNDSCNIRLTNCTLNGGNSGLQWDGAEGNFYLSDCIIYGGNYGIWADNYDSNINLINCKISGDGNAVDLNGDTNNISFINCVITGGANGVNLMTYGSTSNFTHCTIVNTAVRLYDTCVFNACNIMGYVIGASSDSSTIVKLSDCSVWGLEQESPSWTMRWNIIGCRISEVYTTINGDHYGHTLMGSVHSEDNEYVYFPYYSNYFGI